VKLATSRYANKAVGACGLAPVGFTNGDPKFRLPYPLAANLPLLAPPRWALKLGDQTKFRAVYRKHLDVLRLGGLDRDDS
jgi:hypothetical protein